MKITMEFARQDDCLDKMVPSDLRQLVGDKERAEEQCKALAARVEVLRSAINTALHGTVFDKEGNRDDDGLIPFKETKTAITVLSDALSATPAACLAHVRAEAVDMFASELAARVEVPNASPQKIEFYKAAIRHAITFAQGCAERIRQEVK